MMFYMDSSKYFIADDIWNKHLQMHYIRPKEALISNLKMNFYNERYTNNDIENMINNEYKIYSDISDIIDRAKEKYNTIK